LRDVLNDVLGDGGSNAYYISTAPTTACARVLQTSHLVTSVVDWLYDGRHSAPSRVMLGMTALVNTSISFYALPNQEV